MIGRASASPASRAGFRGPALRAILGMLSVLLPVIAVLGFAQRSAWAQCAMCGTTVSSSQDPLGHGMYLSILFMIGAPYLLFFSIAGWIFYVYRRAAKRSAVASPLGGTVAVQPAAASPSDGSLAVALAAAPLGGAAADQRAAGAVSCDAGPGSSIAGVTTPHPRLTDGPEPLLQT